MTFHSSMLPMLPTSTSRLLETGKPGNRGKLGLFLDLYEITPQINRQGKFLLDENDGPADEVTVTHQETSPGTLLRLEIECR